VLWKQFEKRVEDSKYMNNKQNFKNFVSSQSGEYPKKEPKSGSKSWNNSIFGSTNRIVNFQKVQKSQTFEFFASYLPEIYL